MHQGYKNRRGVPQPGPLALFEHVLLHEGAAASTALPVTATVGEKIGLLAG